MIQRGVAGLCLGLLAPLFATALAAQQPASLNGILMGRYGDPASPAAQPRLAWSLRDDAGTVWRVDLPDALVSREGGFRSLQGRRVTLGGTTAAAVAGSPRLQATTLRQAAGASLLQPPQFGAKPYVVLLCRFSDIASSPISVAEASALMGPGYPNLDDFYREVSDDQMNFTGSAAYGWFNLPSPRSTYVTGSSANLDLLAQDCTAQADATVNFASFAGIIIQVNGDLDGFAWGGSRFMTLDGVSRSWPMTWMPLWATQASKHGVYQHEVGHSLGLPHSSGPYGVTYDSDWDVMSNSYLVYNPATSSYTGGQTIIYHKDLLGWIPAGRKVTVGPGVQSYVLERSELPTAGTDPLEIVIPIGATSQFYTLEARRHVGYDTPLPGEGVIIHKVTPGAGIPARVVDPDNNGDPNDAGAIWVTGETWTEGTGILVTVGAATANGWNVTVTMPGVSRLLTVAGAGTGNGTIASAPSGVACTSTAGSTTGTCSASFTDGTIVTLTASATSGTFGGWGGACSGTGSCQVTMDQARSVSATFTAAASQTLTVSGQGAGTGSVSSSPSGIACTTVAASTSGSCSANFPGGSTVQLVANPAGGNAFAGWTGACTGSGACAVTMSTARAVTARFEPVVTHVLTVTPAGTGTGTIASTPAGISCQATAGTLTGTCSAPFTEGTVVTLAANATAGSFTGWTGACSGAGGCAVTLNADAAVGATFTLPTHPLTISGGGDGSGTVASSPAGIGCTIIAGVAGSGCDATFTEGTVVTLTAAAVAGSFTGWSGACSGSGDCQVTVDQARGVTATFTLPRYVVTVALAGSADATITSAPAGISCSRAGGVTTGTCSAEFVTGTSLTLNFTSSGYPDGWSGACAGSAGACVLSVTAPVSVNASFVSAAELIQLATEALLGRGTLSAQRRSTLDAIGNQNGAFDVGDLAELVHDTPGASLGAVVQRRSTAEGRP